MGGQSVRVASKFGWEWCFCNKRKIWHFYHSKFKQYQWKRPAEWCAMRYISFEGSVFFDCDQGKMLDSAEDLIAFEIVDGNPDIKDRLESGEIQLPDSYEAD